MSKPGSKSKFAVWGRIRPTISNFMRSECGGAAKRLFALLILCMLVLNGLNVVNSYVGRDFISSVESRDMPRFMWVSLVYVLVFAGCTVVAVFYRFVEERFALLWREWQTRRFLDRYLANRAYLRLATNGSMENPDQRIAEDVRAFATSSLSIFLMTLNAVFTVFAFSGVMWSISPLLFTGAVAYGLLGTLVTVFLGRRLVGLKSRQADNEAVFRSELLQVRKNAEVIAMQRREHQASDRLVERFAEVVANASRMIVVNRNVSFFTTGYNYLIPVIPVFVVAHLFMWGKVEFGVITQSSLAFAQLMGAFSLIVSQFQSLSSYAAVTARIRVLGEALESASSLQEEPIRLVPDDQWLACEDLSLKSLTDQYLVNNLDFKIPSNCRMLVRSDDYSANRALFRSIAGLTKLGVGLIRRPEQTHFLPERPCLPDGSLRSLLAGDNGIDDMRRGEALAAVGLGDLPARFGGWNTARSWSEELTLDEQSLLAAARALLGAPVLVILDHPAAILDPEQERRVFNALMERGIGWVSLGRVNDDSSPFERVLHISGDGTWFWEKAAPGA